MNETRGNGVYPSAPLETEITNTTEPLLAAALPPSYEQAMAIKTSTMTTPSCAEHRYPPYTPPQYTTAPTLPTPPPPTPPSQTTIYIPPSVPAPPHIVYVTPPNVNQPRTPLSYGPRPVDMQCPYCNNFIRTRLRHKPTARTHLIAFLLCFFQLYCCAVLPYCIASCMKTQHYCGLCHNYLGTYAVE